MKRIYLLLFILLGVSSMGAAVDQGKPGSQLYPWNVVVVAQPANTSTLTPSLTPTPTFTGTVATWQAQIASYTATPSYTLTTSPTPTPTANTQSILNAIGTQGAINNSYWSANYSNNTQTPTFTGTLTPTITPTPTVGSFTYSATFVVTPGATIIVNLGGEYTNFELLFARSANDGNSSVTWVAPAYPPALTGQSIWTSNLNANGCNIVNNKAATVIQIQIPPGETVTPGAYDIFNIHAWHGTQ